MNTIQKKSSSRKKVTIIAITVLVLLVAAAAFAYKMKLWPFLTSSHSTTNGVNYNPPTKAQSNATGSTKQSNTTEKTGSDASPSPTPSTTSGQKPTVNMQITAANETSGTLYIRTLIETISSSGTCTLSMSGPGNQTYTATAGVQANPSTSTCQGFNVPVSSLSSGTWHILINYEDSNVKATASKDVVLQ